jgi:predicted nuclease of predicted toxin-antitoxin system
VLKTVGLAEPLRDALKPLSSAIRAAFVYGSVAMATDQSASDIDLMIISDSLTYGEVFGALERVTRTVGRRVNPTVCEAARLPLLTDENIAPDVVEGLRARGCDLRTAAEERLIGRPDVEVLERATSQGRVVVTHDRGFGRSAIIAGATFLGLPDIVVTRSVVVLRRTSSSECANSGRASSV